MVICRNSASSVGGAPQASCPLNPDIVVCRNSAASTAVGGAAAGRAKLISDPVSMPRYIFLQFLKKKKLVCRLVWADTDNPVY